MIEKRDLSGDRAALVVPRAGRLAATGDCYEPYRMTGPDGRTVEPVREFFRDLLAAGRSESTVRSYGMDLLRWFRFCWAAGVAWDRAARADARDFSRWLKQGRGGAAFAPSVRAHSETVLRHFYSFCLDAGTGPVINPFPLDRSRKAGRAHAHHNPMEPYRNERSGLYRPRVPSRIPRAIPDEEFNAIFARLPSHRDRALVAFYVSTGARASELLSVTAGGVDPGRQLITVVRKGTGELQQLPASSDAFVWLRLYQVQMGGLIPPSRRQPLWWTLRRPVRPLTYHAVHRMFERVNHRAGTAATLHSLRHTAAYRMAEDPALPLTDVQAVLGHALLATTQIYLTPRTEEVIRRVLAHHAGQARQAAARAPRVDTITGREKGEKLEHVLTTVQQRRRGVGTMGRCWDGPWNGRTVRWSTTACGSEPNATHKNNPMTAPPTPNPPRRTRRATGRLGCYLSRGSRPPERRRSAMESVAPIWRSQVGPGHARPPARRRTADGRP